MSDDNIESRLTDYLDNALSPEERAEIEKYLENNPRQKQILAQLAETRGLLKLLDHAEAPEEILETIQSQLERDQLLGEPIEAPSPSRSRKLMQTFLVAAILVMAVGLAAVIYKMMAPPGERAADVAIATSAPAEESAPAAVPALKSLRQVQAQGPGATTTLYGDGHNLPVPNPFYGVQRDNIYTISGASTFPATLPAANDSLLLPTDDDQATTVPATTQATSRPATTRAIREK